MELTLVRTHSTELGTTGILSIDGAFQCYICEDPIRPVGIKIPGKTAIPEGRYEITVTFSKRFQRPLPLLMNVPNFEGIRIHPGNTAADTEGCLLPGKHRDVASATVQLSIAAFMELFGKLKAALEREKVFINIEMGS